MKKIYAILSFVVLCSAVNAQYCYWATRFGGSLTDEGTGMTTDASGNIYITGSYESSSITIGTTTLVNNGSADFYLAKYNSSGVAQWAIKTGQNLDEAGRCVAVDAAGNIYVAGNFSSDTIFFGALYAVNSAIGNYDMFLAKFDSNGNPLWVRSSSGTNDETPNAIAIDASGNVVVAGKYGAASMTVGSTTVTNTGFGSNLFIAHWSANGSAIWLKGAGKANNDVVYDLATDNTNGIYVTGFFQADTLRIGSAFAVNSTPGNEEIFTAKLDTAGNTVYLKSIGGDDSDFGYSIAVDAAGSAYIAGAWRSSSMLVGATTYSGAGNYDLVIVKYDATGNVDWSKSIGASSEESARSIALDAAGNVYVMGDYWSSSLAFATGTCAQFAGGSDMFLVKYNSSGIEQYVTSQNGVGSQWAYNLAANGTDDVVVAGSFGGGLTFGSTTLNSSGGSRDPFIAHIYSFTTAISSSTNITCFGADDGTATVTPTGGFSPYTYLWANNGGTAATATGMTIGHDTAIVTDANGCVSLSVVLITQPTQLTSNVTHLDVDCSLGQQGSASVTAGGGTPGYTYAWTGGGTTSSISNLTAGTYIITTTDANGCTDVDSAVVISVPTAVAPICMVTVDSASQFNIIMWDETGFANADSFIVYREISTNDYRRIGARALEDSSFFIDTVRTLYAPNTGDPNNGTYRYKLQVRDTCGQLSAMSDYHNTIYIINTLGTFSWPSLYTIENNANPVTNYVLWRDNVSDGNWVPVASVAGTQQVVSDPNYATYASTATWRVQTLWSISCTPSARYADPSVQSNWNSSFSNMQGQAILLNTGTESAAPVVTVYPSVTKDQFTLNVAEYSNATVCIYSSVGELISSQTLTSPQTQLDLSNQAAGIYFVTVRNANGVSTQKVIRQ